MYPSCCPSESIKLLCQHPPNQNFPQLRPPLPPFPPRPEFACDTTPCTAPTSELILKFKGTGPTSEFGSSSATRSLAAASPAVLADLKLTFAEPLRALTLQPCKSVPPNTQKRQNRKQQTQTARTPSRSRFVNSTPLEGESPAPVRQKAPPTPRGCPCGWFFE